MEQRRDKLSRSFRFVAGAETAREHQNLRTVNGLDDRPDRRFDIMGRQIPDDQGFDAAARFFKRLRRIILAVRAGENGNKDPWPGYRRLGPGADSRSCKRFERGRFPSLFGDDGEHFRQRLLPSLLRRIQANFRSHHGNHRCRHRPAKRQIIDSCQRFGCGQAARQFQHQRTRLGPEQLFSGNLRRNGKPDAVAEPHRADGGGDPAAADGPRRYDLLAANHRRDPGESPVHHRKIRHAGVIPAQRNENDFMAGLFEFRG